MPKYILYPHRQRGSVETSSVDSVVLDFDRTRDSLTHLINITNSAETIEKASIVFEMLNIAEDLADKQMENKGTLPGEVLRNAHLTLTEWTQRALAKEARVVLK